MGSGRECPQRSCSGIKASDTATGFLNTCEVLTLAFRALRRPPKPPDRIKVDARSAVWSVGRHLHNINGYLTV